MNMAGRASQAAALLVVLSCGVAHGRPPAVKWSAKLSFVNGRPTLLAAGRRHLFYDNFYHVARRQIATGRLTRKLPGAHEGGPGENVQDIRVHKDHLLYLEVSEPGEEVGPMVPRPRGPHPSTLVVTDPRGKRLWTRDGRMPPPVAVARSRIFVVEQGKLLALDLQSGKVLWKIPLKESPTMGPSAGANLVVVQTKASVLAVEQQSGKRIWRRPMPGKSRAAAVFGQRALFLAHEKDTGKDKTTTTLLALQLANGAPVWSKVLPRRMVFNAPVVAGGSLFVATSPDVAENSIDRPTPLLALSAATGKQLWQSPIVSSTDLDVGPAVWRDQVLVWSHDFKDPLSRPCQLRGLDRSTGRLLWTFRAPRSRGGCTVSRPLVQGDLILFSNRSRLYALRARAGRRSRRQD